MDGSEGSIKLARNKRRNVLDGKVRAYRQLWRVVDGAVFDALYTHQDYLTDRGKRLARMSINKRVVGAVIGFAEQSARGRSSVSEAAERVTAVETPSSRTVQTLAVSKWRAIREGFARRFARLWHGEEAA